MNNTATSLIIPGLNEIKDAVADAIVTKVKNSIIGFGKWVLMGLITNSYWIFLWCAIIATILYIIGIKKAGKYITISIMLHLILQMAKAAII